MKNSKKGFTLVELAIALVVIGLVISISIKGKSLIDAAHMRAEVAKIYKIQTATNLYFLNRGNMNLTPGTYALGEVDIKDFVAANYLSPKDVYSDLVSAPAIGNNKKDVSFEIVRCKNETMGGQQYFSQDATSSRMCIYFRPHEDYACNIEVMLDDSNASKGMARFFTNSYTPQAVSSLDATYENCFKLAKKLPIFATHLSGAIYGVEIY